MRLQITCVYFGFSVFYLTVYNMYIRVRIKLLNILIPLRNKVLIRNRYNCKYLLVFYQISNRIQRCNCLTGTGRHDEKSFESIVNPIGSGIFLVRPHNVFVCLLCVVAGFINSFEQLIFKGFHEIIHLQLAVVIIPNAFKFRCLILNSSFKIVPAFIYSNLLVVIIVARASLIVRTYACDNIAIKIF